MTDRLSFAWWNTSLSPKAEQRSTTEQQTHAVEVIRHLTAHLGIDCLALGEVAAEDIKKIMTETALKDYEFFDGTFKIGTAQFDIGVLYRKRTLHLSRSRPLISSRGTHSLKVANSLEFRIPSTAKPLHIFVSHWPSRLRCEKNSPDRNVLAMRLREAIDDLYNTYREAPQAILLGDFNDEPFDSSLSELLLATRDRRFARRNPKLLYNPFWRCVGEAVPHVPGAACTSYSGSYYYASGVDTKWRTFDQIIFSSAFLGHGEWHLNEKYTRIVYLEPFDKAVLNRKEIFDHFPVVSVIEREGKNG